MRAASRVASRPPKACVAPTLITRSNKCGAAKSAASSWCRTRRSCSPRVRAALRACASALGDVDALGPQLGMRGQGAQEPLPTTAAEVEYPRAISRDAAFQQSAHRVVVERGRNRMIRMGKRGDLFTIHRRSLARTQAARTCFSRGRNNRAVRP